MEATSPYPRIMFKFLVEWSLASAVVGALTHKLNGRGVFDIGGTVMAFINLWSLCLTFIQFQISSIDTYRSGRNFAIWCDHHDHKFYLSFPKMYVFISIWRLVSFLKCGFDPQSLLWRAGSIQKLIRGSRFDRLVFWMNSKIPSLRRKTRLQGKRTEKLTLWICTERMTVCTSESIFPIYDL